MGLRVVGLVGRVSVCGVGVRTGVMGLLVGLGGTDGSGLIRSI